jgi:hypothetical protein
MPDRKALASVPGAPSHPAWISWLKTHPDRKAEIEALRHGRATPGIDAIAANFDAMLALLEAGHSPESAGKELAIFGRKIHDYLRKYPDQRARYVAAVKKRERGPNRRGTKISVAPKRKRWSVDQFDAAVAFIARSHDTDIEAALRQANLPSATTMYFRANRNPDFRRRFYRALAAYDANTAHLRHVADSAEPHLLLASLLRDELFAKVWAKFKRYTESRYDLASEAVTAILAGEMELSDLKQPKVVRALGRRALGSSYEFQSLDAPKHDDGESRDMLGDTIASQSDIIFY